MRDYSVSASRLMLRANPAAISRPRKCAPSRTTHAPPTIT